jgi:hypothetical protein
MSSPTRKVMMKMKRTTASENGPYFRLHRVRMNHQHLLGENAKLSGIWTIHVIRGRLKNLSSLGVITGGEPEELRRRNVERRTWSRL